MPMSKWFLKRPERTSLTGPDVESLRVLANRSDDRPYPVNLKHLGGQSTIYVENPAQVGYFEAADEAIQALSD